MHDDRELERKFASILPCLDQRQRRLLAAAEARSWGSGGIRRVSRASGISHAAFQRAWKALDAPPPPAGRIRRPGGGRQQIRATTPAIRDTLEQGIAPETRGDPRSPRRWTDTSTRQLAAALAQRGCSLSPRVVGELLPSLGDSLQAMAMTLEGRRPPDRDAPVRSINEVSGRSLAAGLPVIAVDPQKKELVGRSANGGREGRPVGDPEEGNTPAFPDPRIGKAIPYGIADRGWDLGGQRRCRSRHGPLRRREHPPVVVRHGVGVVPRCALMADLCRRGGSNGSRVRLGKVALQGLADQTGLEVTVCPCPPGTSQWNQSEHRLVAHITINWRGRPLVSHQVIVALSASTTTATGLEVEARLDPRSYPTKVKVTKEQMKRVQLHPHEFHGEWNSTLKPGATVQHSKS